MKQPNNREDFSGGAVLINDSAFRRNVVLSGSASGNQSNTAVGHDNRVRPSSSTGRLCHPFNLRQGRGRRHGRSSWGKDEDDFILSLIRTPAFLEKVNDIAVEFGNSLYQPISDRYIAAEDVPFTEARKVWRNTTQLMCAYSGFFEQFFPLVRAINQKPPRGRRLRVLAGDPPIDWD